jgi:hypothetical protein
MKNMLEKLKIFYESKSAMTVQEFKQCCGVARKYAIHFLGYLDSVKVTRRAGDVRIFLLKENKSEKNMAEQVLR